jgi:precorrin-6B methylase 2
MSSRSASAPPDCSIYVCARASTYRRLAEQLPRADDVVVEVGAAGGATTRRLAQTAGRVIAIEKSASMVEEAREAVADLENVTVLHSDAHRLGPVLELVESADIVLIDVAGSAPPFHTAKLGETYRHHLRPRILVLRNTRLTEFARLLGYVERE